MTTTKYRVIMPDPANGNPFFYVCASLEELCFVYKFVEYYNLYLDVYTNVTVQRARTEQELYEYQMKVFQEEEQDDWYFIDEDDPDYWVPYTDEFVELTKAKTMQRNEDDDDDMPTAPHPQD